MEPGPELLPIFPLAGVVLFPSLRTPLHIFEPRYRQMTEASLAGDRRIGMVTILPEHAAATAGDPPIFSLGCAGIIEDSHRLPDGRYNIVLVGTQRFRIVAERPPTDQRLYRVAEVTLLEEPRGLDDAPAIAAARTRVIERADELLRRLGRGEGLPAASFDSIDDANLVNLLCSGFSFAAPEKQSLLEADGIRERFERLEELLDFSLAALGAGKPPNSAAIH